MKDTHNVILIIVSSKWSSFFFASLFIMSHFSVRDAPSFLFWSSKFSALSHHEAPPRLLQGFTLCFQLLFLSIILFITGVLHERSTWWFVKDSFHSSIVLQDFSWSYDPSSYTQKLNMVLNTCFVLRCSSILLLAFRSAILSTLSFEVVLCHSWQFPFMFLDSHVVKNEVF